MINKPIKAIAPSTICNDESNDGIHILNTAKVINVAIYNPITMKEDN